MWESKRDSFSLRKTFSLLSKESQAEMTSEQWLYDYCLSIKQRMHWTSLQLIWLLSLLTGEYINKYNIIKEIIFLM